MEPYRVILADDHILFRQGMKKIFDEIPQTQVVGRQATAKKPLNM
jgi:DNA-binding NarL/FixJ family response regulator